MCVCACVPVWCGESCFVVCGLCVCVCAVCVIGCGCGWVWGCGGVGYALQVTRGRLNARPIQHGRRAYGTAPNSRGCMPRAVPRAPGHFFLIIRVGFIERFYALLKSPLSHNMHRKTISPNTRRVLPCLQHPRLWQWYPQTYYAQRCSFVLEIRTHEDASFSAAAKALQCLCYEIVGAVLCACSGKLHRAHLCRRQLGGFWGEFYPREGILRRCWLERSHHVRGSHDGGSCWYSCCAVRWREGARPAQAHTWPAGQSFDHGERTAARTQPAAP